MTADVILQEAQQQYKQKKTGEGNRKVAFPCFDKSKGCKTVY